MTTFQELIDDTYAHLMTGQPDRLNTLSSNIDNSTQSVSLAQPVRGVDSGSRITIGLEVMHVLSVASSTLTVIRGVDGSTPASHTSGDIIRINPQFTPYIVGKRINQSFNSLTTSGLFQAKSIDFTFTPTQRGYDLPASDLIDIITVRYDRPGPEQEWPVIPRPYWRLDQAADTGDFASGNQLVLLTGGFPGHTVRVTYKAPYSQLTDLTDDVASVSGLHAEAHDIPPMWAAVRLLSGRDIKRTFLNRQPEPRRQEEVPPGAAIQSMDAIVALLMERLVQEGNRLKRRYPQETGSV